MSKLTEEELDRLERLLSVPIFFPKEFKTWVTDFAATNIPMIPFSQVFGSKLNVGRSAPFILAREAPVSPGSYGELTTEGPKITNIVKGEYLIFFGATEDGGFPNMAPSINGGTPSDNESLKGKANPFPGFAGSRAVKKTLPLESNNTVEMLYKNADANDRWAKRWMTLIRVGSS